MMRRNPAAARVIPAPADSDSGSSTSAPPPHPGRKQATHSALQVRAGAPVIPPAPPGHPGQAVEGSATSPAVSGTTINGYLRTYGLIPMTRSEGSAFLNALAAPDDSQPPPPPPRDRPLICAYCNSAFCFGAHEANLLDLGLGHVYPAPPSPITLNLLTPPPVGPLYRDDRDLRAPGATLARLLVCSAEHHFRATMGRLQRLPGGAPSLVWTCTSCLRVLPIVVGSEGASSPDLHADPAPPPEPWTYAGAYWNYVKLGDEDMVKLKLHHYPLNLTLGRR